jgi:hypothetical protein
MPISTPLSSSSASIALAGGQDAKQSGIAGGRAGVADDLHLHLLFVEERRGEGFVDHSVGLSCNDQLVALRR